MRIEIACRCDTPAPIRADDGSISHEPLPLSADARELKPLIGTAVCVLWDLDRTNGPIIGTVEGVRAEGNEGWIEIDALDTPEATEAMLELKSLKLRPITRIADGSYRETRPNGRTVIIWHAEAVAFVPVKQAPIN